MPAHRRPGWPRRAVMLLAHAQPAVLACLIVADVAWALTDVPALFYVHAGVLAVVALALAAELYHEHGLCPRCAAGTPEDGPAAAERHPRWLRLHHWATEHAHYALILIIGGAVAFRTGAWWLMYPVYATWAIVAYAHLVHRPLQPWCPDCQGWDWDGDNREVDPVTPPAAGATP